MKPSYVREWYRTSEGWKSTEDLALKGELPRTTRARLASHYQPDSSAVVRQSLVDQLCIEPSRKARLHVPWVPTLRESLEKARDLLPEGPHRVWLEQLLAQKSREYGTLVDECEIAIYG